MRASLDEITAPLCTHNTYAQTGAGSIGARLSARPLRVTNSRRHLMDMSRQQRQVYADTNSGWARTPIQQLLERPQQCHCPRLAIWARQCADGRRNILLVYLRNREPAGCICARSSTLGQAPNDDTRGMMIRATSGANCLLLSSVTCICCGCLLLELSFALPTQHHINTNLMLLYTSPEWSILRNTFGVVASWKYACRTAQDDAARRCGKTVRQDGATRRRRKWHSVFVQQWHEI